MLSSTPSPSLTVDRIEGDIAVVEGQDIVFDIPMSALPATILEGDRIQIVIAKKDNDEAEAKARLRRLKAAGPKQDTIDL